MRLSGMHHAYKSQLELPLNQQLETHDMVAHLVQSEDLMRSNEKTAYYLRLAKLRLPASIDQIECRAAHNLTKQQLAFLAEGIYLQQEENILITGSTGCGKSFLACALGHPGLPAGL
jgi:DNA replication protein DnaC